MTVQDRDRIAALGHLCEMASKSALLADHPAVARFHRESAEHFSLLAFGCVAACRDAGV